MTWPSSDVTTTAMDAGTDVPPRAEIKSWADKFNQLRNHVSAFMQGLLESATASDARATLDVPTRTGGNASGNWSINATNITGTAAIANGGTGQTTAAAAFSALKQDATASATGVVELATSAEYATGTDTTRALTSATARAENIVQGAAVSLVGLQTYDFTGIPSWVKEITLTINAVSSSGNDLIAALIGDSGGIEATGYNGSILTVSGTTVGTSASDGGLYFITSNAASVIHNGEITIKRHDSATNVWAMAANLSRSDSAGTTTGTKLKALSGALDRVRVSVAAGTFDGNSSASLAYK